MYARLAVALAVLFLPSAAAHAVPQDEPLPLDGNVRRFDGVGSASHLDLLWIDGLEGNLRFDRLPFASGRLLEPTAMAQTLAPRARADFPRIAGAGEDRLLMWSASGAGAQNLEVERVILLADGTFGEVKAVHPTPGRDTLPSLACGDTECWAVWQTESAPNRGDWRIVGSRVMPGIGPLVSVSDNPPGTKADFPSAVVWKGQLAVAWADQRNASAHEIRVVSWSGEGDAPASAVVSGMGRPGTRTNPVLAADQELLVAWVDSADSTQRTLEYSALTGAWSAPQQLASVDSASLPNHPVAGVTGHGFEVAWEDARHGVPRIAVARVWEPQALVYPADSDNRQWGADFVALAGTTVVLFSESAEGRGRVRLASEVPIEIGLDPSSQPGFGLAAALAAGLAAAGAAKRGGKDGPTDEAPEGRRR